MCWPNWSCVQIWVSPQRSQACYCGSLMPCCARVPYLGSRNDGWPGTTERYSLPMMADDSLCVGKSAIYGARGTIDEKLAWRSVAASLGEHSGLRTLAGYGGTPTSRSRSAASACRGAAMAALPDPDAATVAISASGIRRASWYVLPLGASPVATRQIGRR